MAQLKDTIVSGSLRVTDSIFTTNLNLSSLTASYAVLTDANKNLVSRGITDNTTAASNPTANTNLITANTLLNYKGTTNINTVGTITSGTWQGTTVGTAYGGTGNNSFTANRLVWTESATKFTAANHYASSTKVGICYTSEPTQNFAVSGTSLLNGNTTIGSTTAGALGLAQTGGTGLGISLYGGPKAADALEYGLAFVQTSNWGKYGDFMGDWGTYFTMNAANQRGWAWKVYNSKTPANFAASLSSRGALCVKAVGTEQAYIAYPGGGQYDGAAMSTDGAFTTTSAGTTVTGALQIKLPINYASYMLSFDVRIYNYNTSATVIYHIQGYPSGTNWHYYHAWSEGIDEAHNNLAVRFCGDGTNVSVCIGEVGTTWSYPKVAVTDVVYGHSNSKFSSMPVGWSINFLTTLPTTTHHTIYEPHFKTGAMLDMNRISTADAHTVISSISTWNHGKTGAGSAKLTDVWGQRWKANNSSWTYTPDGGSATQLTDTGDLMIFLSKAAASNNVYANLVIDGNMYASTFVGSLTGNATTATTASSCSGNAATATALANTASDVSATAVTGALQAFWNANKTTLVRNKLISFTSSHSGRALHMGYFINGYDSSPYGGFFTAFYGTPYYSYASNGTFGCSELVRNDSRSYSISVTGSAGSVTWANVSGKPDQATRWAKWNEIGDGADNLSEGSSNWTDNTEILTSYASNNGFADTNAKGKVYRRDAVCAYNYIKGKAEGNWGIKATNVTGTVAIANGGTGKTTAAEARANLGVPAAVSSAHTKVTPPNGNDGWIQFGSTTTYGILPGTSGAAGSGHCYIGTSSWYWAYAYIDNIYGTLTGSASQIKIAGGTGATYYNVIGVPNYASGAQSVYVSSPVKVNNVGVTCAIWNDFAEYRESNIQEPGRVLISNGKGQMILCNKRLVAGAKIVSDTFGFSVGRSDNAKTPLGITGRVLAYPYQDRKKYKVGDAVCAAPNGTIDIMTREEIIKYPDMIIGIVDEIPDYKIWNPILTNTKDDKNTTQVDVNDRIWIYVR